MMTYRLPLIGILFFLSGLSLQAQVKDVFSALPPGQLRLTGYLEHDIRRSLEHWNKGVVPYQGLVDVFRQGRAYFAQGEMWGKAVRSGAMFYRYTHDTALKRLLKATVDDLLSTRRANGTISPSAVDKQPDGPGGELWERAYLLLGLERYYTLVEQDPRVLRAMIDEADATLDQIGPPPKVSVLDQGWSPNHIESSTILEPIMRLYKLTGYSRYLDFARYLVKEGGTKGDDIISGAFDNRPPLQLGPVYPKAYEMLSLFEGLVEFYRATGQERWKQAALNLYHGVLEREITIIGNGGGDQPYHPEFAGEAWDNTALEQTNPDMKRMMETCVGVTWMKYCIQLLRLTGDPSMADAIERYVYNGLIGAMKPEGDGFSYVNLLNGVKTDTRGWGGVVDGIPVTCCNLNGPVGLAYIPYVAVMQSATGPVVNLYNAASATLRTPAGHEAGLSIDTRYPDSGTVVIRIDPATPEQFSVRLRIPAWSRRTTLTVNGRSQPVQAGTYARLTRTWKKGDRIVLQLDMRCRVIPAPHGSNRAGDHRQALVRGPIVLARDENLDSAFDQPVALRQAGGYVRVVPVAPSRPGIRQQFRVPTLTGDITMVDYASVDSWNGKLVCTWMPLGSTDR